MRLVSLSKSGINKVRSHLSELKASDIEGSIKSIPPGEWCLFQTSQSEGWLGFINPQIEDRFTCAHLLAKTTTTAFNVEELIKERLSLAFKRRMRISDYKEGARIFYGVSDGLPGLIIDSFFNASIIQINTAGVDRYRDLIRKFTEDLTGHKAYFLDNPKYREKEYLPTFTNDSLPAITILENNLKYEIRSEVLQKVGFYYDHRENRRQLMNLLARLTDKPKNAIDLFSYVGAWGMSALHAGVEAVDFVDQGDFNIEVETSIKLNGFNGKGTYHRSDVFKYLDAIQSQGKTYDLILCDPPAFAKSAHQKDQALDGYSKLHRKVFKIASNLSICAFSSCTHYVGHEEFQKNILDAARKESRKIQLIYTGMQGWDHPVVSLEDKSNYIKSYFYFVE